jgi:hypothetical protein
VTRTPGAAVLAEVAGAGHCTHPVVLSGETVDTETGEIRRSVLRIACKDRRSTICPSCSYLYKTDAWILISTGLVGGKGLPPDVLEHPKVFVTLTAPSFGAVHRRTDQGECHPRARSPRCEHGHTTRCGAYHGDDDPMLGAPLCTDCFDYEGAVLWNATASALWHRTMVRLRQGIAATQHLTETRLLQVARLNYLKVAEFQRRGLVHFHVVLRADGPDGAGSPSPEWLTTEVLAHQLGHLVRHMAYRAPSGVTVSWGERLTITDLAARDGDGRRVTAYLAKYATKSTDGSVAFARRFQERGQIERAPVHDHARRLALTAWDLGGHDELGEERLQRHAHSFGFTGQLITKSQGFSTTFTALRGARASHMAGLHESTAMALGTFRYAGRGYSDPRGEVVAELLHEATVELHQVARERRVAALRDSRNRSRDGSRDRSHSSRDGSRDRSRAVAERDADPQ